MGIRDRLEVFVFVAVWCWRGRTFGHFADVAATVFPVVGVGLKGGGGSGGAARGEQGGASLANAA